jgi:gliding motility-associated protein GldM
MAGGKLTPRQKMINLMYLVFIAMLALNMSKEVLSAFGLMTEKLTYSNEDAKQRIDNDLKAMETQMASQPEKFGPLVAQAKQVEKLSNEFYAHIEGLKSEMLKTVDDPKDYEVQDKPDFLDEKFFIGDKLKPAGTDFINKIKSYKEGLAKVLGKDSRYTSVLASVNKSFSTDPVKNRDGNSVDWLEYHYKGFPMVASLTKLSAIQSDIRKAQSDVLTSMVAEKLKVEASLTNFDAIVVPDKTAFFSGESFKGKIILGKKDATLKANSVVVNGRELPASAMQEGQTILEFPSGSVGEQTIKGKMTFTDFDGKSFEIPVETSYSVIPRPNSATISADKMNVVYRGVDNPMTISFAGVPDNLVSVSAPGLSKGSKSGQYNMNPGQGTDVTINVTGKLPDGTTVSDKKSFRIKNVPPPIGAIAKQMGIIKGGKSRLESAQISAELPDFLYDLKFQVTQFTLKVPGQAAVIVSGDRVNAQCRAALARAGRGDQVTISDIKTIIPGTKIVTGQTAPVIYEIQ